jgi:hypothetical protein
MGVDSTSMLLTTKEAVAYVKSRGRPTVSLGSLRRYRLRAPDDPGEKGPDFVRDDRGNVFYPVQALEGWVAMWKARCKFRAPGKFRGDVDTAA